MTRQGTRFPASRRYQRWWVSFRLDVPHQTDLHLEADNGGIKNPAITTLNQSGQNGDGSYLYRGSVPASESGAYGFSIRVLPTHPHLQQDHELRLITWS